MAHMSWKRLDVVVKPQHPVSQGLLGGFGVVRV